MQESAGWPARETASWPARESVSWLALVGESPGRRGVINFCSSFVSSRICVATVSALVLPREGMLWPPALGVTEYPRSRSVRPVANLVGEGVALG